MINELRNLQRSWTVIAMSPNFLPTYRAAMKVCADQLGRILQGQNYKDNFLSLEKMTHSPFIQPEKVVPLSIRRR